ncbi:unnamed protein product, partial [Chrysoparadoxa australica]
MKEDAEHLLSQNSKTYKVITSIEDGDLLHVVVKEVKGEGRRWSGRFPRKYVEDISQKTGNSKDFATFVKMLRSALSGGSEFVFVDLLTYQDLEDLKAKKRRGAAAKAASNPLQATKRYLILTYVVEFDRVH